jgi:hypothetical protein
MVRAPCPGGRTKPKSNDNIEPTLNPRSASTEGPLRCSAGSMGPFDFCFARRPGHGAGTIANPERVLDSEFVMPYFIWPSVVSQANNTSTPRHGCHGRRPGHERVNLVRRSSHHFHQTRSTFGAFDQKPRHAARWRVVAKIEAGTATKIWRLIKAPGG